MLTERETTKINYPETAKISVIIVTYNAAETLQTCLNSIYKQKYPAIEIIVIDGKSTDGTIEILQKNADKIAYWKSEKDNGIYDAMNKALKHTKGEWVYFLGADDELFDDFSVMANELKDPNTIYYGNVLSNGEKFSGFVPDYLFAKYGIYHQAIIYPAIVFKKYSYDTKYIVRADHVLNLKCAGDKKLRFMFKDYTIAQYNHLGMSSNSIDEPFEKDQAGIVFRNFSLKVGLRIMFWKFKEKYIRKHKLNQPDS
jgi:cellulose synthase/poly-beta-1,6-N-acetylglucosamine synthase-like glycosyltransferase